MIKAVVFVVLFLASLLMAQVNEGENQHPPKSQKGQLTAQGCVSRSSGYYVHSGTVLAVPRRRRTSSDWFDSSALHHGVSQAACLGEVFCRRLINGVPSPGVLTLPSLTMSFALSSLP